MGFPKHVCKIVQESVRNLEVGEDIICLSTILTTTMPAIGNVIKEIENSGVRVRDKYYSIVGGAPVSQIFAD